MDPTDPKPARSDKDILEEAKERLKRAIDEHSEERKKQKDDLLFSTLEQWPSSIRSDRESDPNGARPCLTIDQINQYIVQVVNDLRQNRPAVKARPVDDQADPETAEVFQGVIRQIEDQSTAQIPYMTAGESAVRVGEGYFRFITEYENEKSFNQVIKVLRVPDMFCVYLGPHLMPDGSDAEYGFVFEDLPVQKFRRLFPKAKYQSTDFDELQEYRNYWGEDEKIRVCEYFYFDYQPITLCFLEDGTILDKKDLPEGVEPVKERQTRLKTTKWCKLTGIEVLEKRDWAGKYIPIVKVTGKESWVDGKRVVWGLVRPAKDSLRMYNYVASTIVEKFALQPKAPFIGAKGQFENLEDRWQNANRLNYAYLEYNPLSVDGLSVPPPQRQQPAPMEAALYQFLATCREDVQSSLGMFKASLGKEQPNQSGKAILALTRESDTGTYHFSDNLSLSIQHGGRILVDLIPKIYDTKQIVRVLGEDGKIQTAQLDPQQPEAVKQVQTMDGKISKIYNLGVGTYDVTVTVGPSFNTKRMEAATLFTDLATNAKDPSLALVANYFAIKNSDFNGSEKAAEMLEKLMPPGLVQKDGEPQIPPEVMQQMQQMQQQLQMAAEEIQKLQSGEQSKMAKVQVEAQEGQAKIQSENQVKQAELQLKAQNQAQEIQLEREKASAQIQIEREKAQAQCDIAIQKLQSECSIKQQQMDFEKQCHADELMEKEEPTLGPALNGMVKAVQDGISQGFEGLQSGQQQVVEILGQILTEQKRAKAVSLTNIRRDANGSPIGATVTTH